LLRDGFACTHAGLAARLNRRHHRSALPGRWHPSGPTSVLLAGLARDLGNEIAAPLPPRRLIYLVIRERGRTRKEVGQMLGLSVSGVKAQWAAICRTVSSTIADWF
jgi:DNA-binding NarL/FixJ family response regulator